MKNAPLGQDQLVINAIKTALKLRSWRYQDLADAIGVKEITIKKSFSKGRLSLARLDQICAALQLSLQELLKLEVADQTPIVFSREHEELLAADSELFSIFLSVVQGQSYQNIMRSTGLSERKLDGHLKDLDHAGLIERFPRNRLSTRFTMGTAKWESQGPLHKKYERFVTEKFLYSQFTQQDCYYQFRFYRMLPGTWMHTLQKIEKLHKETSELAARDQQNSGALEFGFMLAARPFSLVKTVIDGQ